MTRRRTVIFTESTIVSSGLGAAGLADASR